ncbi:MAG: hypothetical protein H7258_14880 [Ferruginibacter sp.]|nr:hypothetical protein [Ferruginibacter sp.]
MVPVMDKWQLHFLPIFKKVYATAIGSEQLDNALELTNIIYAAEPAKQTFLDNKSADLVTISQAPDWFNLEKLYDEMRQISKRSALIAAFTYNLLKIDAVTDELTGHFYF